MEKVESIENQLFDKLKKPNTKLVIFGVNPEAIERYKVFCRQYASGKLNLGLDILMSYADTVKLNALVLEQVKVMSDKIDYLENKLDSFIDSTPKKKVIKTMSGAKVEV